MTDRYAARALLLLASLLASAPLGCGKKDMAKESPDAKTLEALAPYDPQAETNDEGRVVELKLHGRRVGDRAFDHVKELSELKSLSLYGSAVTDDGLAKLKSLPRLEALGLGKTGVARAGLAHLERLPAVRWVWVTESKTLTPAQVEDFKKKAVPGTTVYQ
jgi:hypothetical protein